MKPRYIIVCADPAANGVKVWADTLETARGQQTLLRCITGRDWRVLGRKEATP